MIENSRKLYTITRVRVEGELKCNNPSQLEPYRPLETRHRGRHLKAFIPRVKRQNNRWYQAPLYALIRYTGRRVAKTLKTAMEKNKVRMMTCSVGSRIILPISPDLQR